MSQSNRFKLIENGLVIIGGIEDIRNGFYVMGKTENKREFELHGIDQTRFRLLVWKNGDVEVDYIFDGKNNSDLAKTLYKIIEDELGDEITYLTML